MFQVVRATGNRLKKISSFKALSGLEIFGHSNFGVDGVCTLFDPSEHCITWVNPDRKIDWTIVNLPKNVLIILDQLPDLEAQALLFRNKIAIVVSENPKRIFSKCMEEMISDGVIGSGNWYDSVRGTGVSIHETAIVNCKIDKRIIKNLNIGPFVFIAENVRIGNDVKIGPSTVIGGDGFGFYDAESGQSVRMPHIGGVVLEDSVEIGANTTIDRGTIGNTILRRNCKVDNLVHAAHNVVVGENAKIVSNTTLCGSVSIGRNVWIGGNSIIRQGLSIGDNSVVGIGSTVVKEVPGGEVWAGSPASFIRGI